jgi:hypothetical protein
MQTKLYKEINLKNGGKIPKGAIVNYEEYSEKLYKVEYNGNTYKLQKTNVIEPESGAHYCKFCGNHKVEAKTNKTENSIQLIIGCPRCKKVYEAYNERV